MTEATLEPGKLQVIDPDDVPAFFESGTVAAVTFDEWFFTTDGQQYKVAFGPVTIIRAKMLLGFEPKNSANWYAQVGYGDKAVLLAGCKVHSAMTTSKKPVGAHVYDAT